MSLSVDLREFIELLNSRGVEYLIVGAHSLAFHGRPRYTGDLDILVRPSPENAEKLAAVLDEFGFTESVLNHRIYRARSNDSTRPRSKPNRSTPGITGVATAEALERKISTELAGLPVFMLSKDLLIQNKRAVGRPQDLADIDALS